MKQIKAVSGAGAALLLAGIMPAQAQQSEIDALKKAITEMTARLDKMEADAKQKATDDKGKPAVTAKFPVTISGLLQAQGSAWLNQSGPNAVLADTFRMRRGEVKISGKIVPRVSGWIMVDPAKNLTLNPLAAVPGTPTVNQSSSILQEIALSYQVKRGDKGATYVDAGQFKIPVGYEGDMVSSSALAFVNRALMFTARDPFAGGYGDIRETGVRLRGSFNEFGYEAGLFNGFGDRQNATAGSDQKAFMGRLTYRPKMEASATVRDLVFGVSGAMGNTLNPGAAVRADRTVMNAFATYKTGPWSSQAEYMQADGQPLGGGTTRDVRSYYGHVGYLFNPKVEAVARYDYFNADRNNAGFSVKDISLGLNYYIKGHNAKIQANVVHRNGHGAAAAAAGSSIPGGLANDSTNLVVQGQVAF